MTTVKQEGASAPAAEPNFSAGHSNDRPAHAPDQSIYHSHNDGARHRFVGGQWQLIDLVHDREPELMAAPTQDELDAAESDRLIAALSAAPTSGEHPVDQPAPTPPARGKPKAK